MAYPDVTLKIHHIDGDMSAPWEYYDTFMKCEVGTPMVVDVQAGAYEAVAFLTIGDSHMLPIKGIWVSMAEYSDGLSFEDVLNAGEGADPSIYISKSKAIPLAYIRNDMVLESVNYTIPFDTGQRVAMFPEVNGGHLRIEWKEKSLDISDKLPAFLVIDVQPMVEGQELPQKLLLRYIG